MKGILCEGNLARRSLLLLMLSSSPPLKPSMDEKGIPLPGSNPSRTVAAILLMLASSRAPPSKLVDEEGEPLPRAI
jgi:hypothetical protein